MYLLKLALRPWRLAPVSQIFSSIAVGVLLLLGGFLFWMQQELKPVISRLQHEQVVTAYLDPGLDAKNEGAVMDSIHLALAAPERSLPGGEAAAPKVDLVHSDQFIKEIKERYPDLGRELEELGPDAGLVVPRYVSVAGVIDDDVLKTIKALPGIQAAETSKDRYTQIVGAFSALRWVAKVLALGIAFAMLMGLVHLSRINAHLHEDAIGLLRLMGAGEWTVRVPGMLSGMGVGMLGGAMGFVGWMTGGVWLTRHVRAISPVLGQMSGFHSGGFAGSVTAATFGLALTLLVSGGLIGMLGGLLALSPGDRR